MYDHKKTEIEMRSLWKKIDLLEKLNSKNRDGETFFLLDGPPYANFIPHIGHMRNTVAKDIFLRINFMKGRNVFFQPGFDTHGLPIENKVEKELNLETKQDIIKLGITNFMNTCKNLAATNKDEWLEVYDLLGSWYSWKKPYLTYDNDYIQTGWWAFKEMWNKGLVYEGQKPVFWCPRCETTLAGYEVTDSYANVNDPLVYVKFRLKDEDAYLLVFTTTPWTLPSNVAICAHPDEDYVKVECNNEKYVLAKKRVELLTELGFGYKIIGEFKGKELDGKRYDPIIKLPISIETNKNPKAHKVYMSIPILKVRVASKIAMKKEVMEEESFGHFVSVDEGSGLVHCAPGHGKTDNEVGSHYGLPNPSPLDDQCKFTDMAGEFQGQFVKSADKSIIALLESTNNMLHHGQINHKYPLCWRCKSKLIFRMSNQWFVKIDREKMLKANEKVEWQPEFANDKFINWVCEAEDWNISRQRFWGIPIPIWRCKETGDIKIIGSLKELKELANEDMADDFDLHLSNNITFSINGNKYERIRDIFDVWFDSGVAPMAAFGYPHKNKELFEKMFPVNRINESQDQTRGWFYYLMCVSSNIFDKAPYKKVSMPGWVVDKKGDKMSKSQGNVIWAKDGINELSADALRFYFFWDGPSYELLKFNAETAKKEVTRMLGVLWNTHIFITSQTESIGKLDPKETEDRWILSKLYSLAIMCDENIEKFEFHKSGKAIMDFILNDVSRGYIQLIRNRIDEGDKQPFAVLNEIVCKLIRLMAPITPYISEQIHQNMKNLNPHLRESVHMEDYVFTGPQDEKLESDMDVVWQIVQASLNAREKMQRSLRWPIGELSIVSTRDNVRKAAERFSELIKNQTNAKDVKVMIDLDGVKKDLKINYGKIGESFGKDTPVIKTELGKIKESDILASIESKGSYEVLGKKIDEKHVIITRTAPDTHIQGDYNGGNIYISKNISQDLEKEGYAREITRRIQELRKTSGLTKDNRIILCIVAKKELTEMLNDQRDAIKAKVGADKIIIQTDAPKEKYNFDAKDKVKEFDFELFMNVD